MSFSNTHWWSVSFSGYAVESFEHDAFSYEKQFPGKSKYNIPKGLQLMATKTH